MQHQSRKRQLPPSYWNASQQCFGSALSSLVDLFICSGPERCSRYKFTRRKRVGGRTDSPARRVAKRSDERERQRPRLPFDATNSKSKRAESQRTLLRAHRRRKANKERAIAREKSNRDKSRGFVRGTRSSRHKVMIVQERQRSTPTARRRTRQNATR